MKSIKNSVVRSFLWIDLLVLLLILSVAHWLGYSIGHKGWVIVLMAFLGAYSKAYRGVMLHFDYYMYVIKTYGWALFFTCLYFVLLEEWPALLLSMLYLTLWGMVAAGYRLILSNRLVQYRFMTPHAEKGFLHFKLKIDSVSHPDQIQLNHYSGLIIQKNHEYSDEWKKFIVHCQIVGLPVLTYQELEEKLLGRVSIDDLQKAWIQNSFGLSRGYILLKRIFDIAFVLLLLPIWGVLWILISMSIAVSMGFPIIFKQERMGQDERIFKVYKFRTMSHGHNHGETTQNDKRVTPLGKLLRKTRLDEIPQFINILKGEMSLIGPRPEWLLTAQQFSAEIPVYHARHLVKPGITGWAQVNQGHVIGLEGNYQKLQYDIFYVKYFSFWLDVKIVLKTIKTVLTGFGAK